MPTSPVQTRLEAHFPRVRGRMKGGAHRFQALLAQSPRLLSDLQVILVGGSNGKGTTCALIEAALRAQGFGPVGFYSSPHLVSPTERVRVDGRPVPPEALDAALNSVELWVARHLPDATFFEIATAAALQVFSKAGCRVVVVEVGLGGRLDSTNALAPLVSCLTSVSLEHTSLLGHTLEAIAFDKAHISRRGRTLVHGSLEAPARKGLEAALALTGAQAWDASQKMAQAHEGVVQQILSGPRPWLRLNAPNVRTAVATLAAFEQATGHKLDWGRAIQGVMSAFWPGRFDVRQIQGQTFLFDAGHNPGCMEWLVAQWSASEWKHEKVPVLFGVLQDKDWGSMIPTLKGLASEFLFACPSGHPDRAQDPHSLLSAANGTPATVCEGTLQETLELLLAKKAPVRVVTGSIAFLGECFEAWGVPVFPPE